MKMTPEERVVSFWNRTRVEGECLIWTGAKNQGGYGLVTYGDRCIAAHRRAWEIANGREIPPGLIAMHSCDNPPCVNPNHISVGTQVDNMRDCARKGRRGPMFLEGSKGEDHPLARLTESDVLSIRERVASGERSGHVAREFSVSRSTISSIVIGRRWQHVGGPRSIRKAATP
jgi:hypothetical protein